jgi:hypothetical protein
LYKTDFAKGIISLFWRDPDLRFFAFPLEQGKTATKAVRNAIILRAYPLAIRSAGLVENVASKTTVYVKGNPKERLQKKSAITKLGATFACSIVHRRDQNPLMELSGLLAGIARQELIGNPPRDETKRDVYEFARAQVGKYKLSHSIGSKWVWRPIGRA